MIIIINCQKNLYTPSVLIKCTSLLVLFLEEDNYVKFEKKNVNESTHFF